MPTLASAKITRVITMSVPVIAMDMLLRQTDVVFNVRLANSLVLIPEVHQVNIRSTGRPISSLLVPRAAHRAPQDTSLNKGIRVVRHVRVVHTAHLQDHPLANNAQ
jgi:hypothetical protein